MCYFRFVIAAFFFMRHGRYKYTIPWGEFICGGDSLRAIWIYFREQISERRISGCLTSVSIKKEYVAML